MKKKTKRRKNKKVINSSGLKIKLSVLLALLVCLLVSFFFSAKIEEAFGLRRTYTYHETTASSVYNENSYVSFIDVGQGSSSFIKLPDGTNILIDGGNTEYGEDVAKFLNERGVTTIDHMIATHSDSDHIGGLNYILEHYEVKNIYRPFQICGSYTSGSSMANFVVDEYEDLSGFFESYIRTGDMSGVSRITTSVYKKFIKNIYTETYNLNGVERQSSVTVFYDGLKIEGENYRLEFFAPLIRSGSYNLSISSSNTNGYATEGYGTTDANGNSAICLLTCLDYKYLFTGDAPYSKEGSNSEKFEELDFVKSLSTSEKLMLSNIDVYVVGHHGSKFSSSEKLLDIIRPRFAVISVGEGNTYGHPTTEAINRIANTPNIEHDYLHRTDKSGTISFAKVDGELMYSLEFESTKSGFTISWFVLGSVIYVVIAVCVLSIRFKKPRKN